MDPIHLRQARARREEQAGLLRAVARLEGQKRALERLAAGDPLPEFLRLLTALCEEQCEGARASVLLLDKEGKRLRIGAAPRLPEAWNARVDGLPIGEAAGSCGTAAHTRRPVLVPDIALDPRWEAYREEALAHGLRACWSVPVISSGGGVLGAFALYHDVPRAPTEQELQHIGLLASTAAIAIERKRSEEALRQAQVQLLQEQKMDAVGQLAGGIAHEYNNLLTAINGYTDLLLAMAADGPEAVYLREVRSAGERAAALTRQILAFGRKRMLAPRRLDLGAAVAGFQGTLGRILGPDAELRLEVEQHVPAVHADPGLLEEAVLHLVLNAREAMPGGGRITVSVAAAGPGGRHAVPWDPDGSWAVLSVRDTGTGMDEAVKARIFEPFFTTKKSAASRAGGRVGTGLGLPAVEGIVKQSGGHLEVTSAPGQGSTFRVFLPAAPEPILSRPAPRSDVPPAPGGGRFAVMVVEDEPTVRALVCRTLAAEGYEVLEAASGEAALAAHAARGAAPLDLLLTDVVMPGMGGREVADRLRAERPGLRVVFMSGFTEDTALHQGVLADGALFLGKPFTPSALVRAVGGMLAEWAPASAV